MRDNNVKALVLSAIFVGLGIVLSYLIVYLPIMSFVPLLVLPLLPIILSEKHGYKYGIMMSVAMSLLMLMFDPLQLVLDIPLLCTGVALGIGVDRKVNPFTNIGLSWIVISITLGGAIWVVGKVTGIHVFDTIIAQIDTVSTMFESQGLDTRSLESMLILIDYAFIGIILSSTLLMVLAIVAMGKFIFKRFDIEAFNGYDILDFSVSRETLIGTIAVFVILYCLRLSGMQMIDSILYNIAFIVVLIASLNAICAINSIMKARKSSRVMRIIIILVMVSLMGQLCFIIGILDSIFALRDKLSPKSERM